MFNRAASNRTVTRGQHTRQHKRAEQLLINRYTLLKVQWRRWATGEDYCRCIWERVAKFLIKPRPHIQIPE